MELLPPCVHDFEDSEGVGKRKLWWVVGSRLARLAGIGHSDGGSKTTKRTGVMETIDDLCHFNAARYEEAL